MKNYAKKSLKKDIKMPFPTPRSVLSSKAESVLRWIIFKVEVILTKISITRLIHYDYAKEIFPAP